MEELNTIGETQNDEATNVDLNQMSEEELREFAAKQAKKAHDQELARKKYQAKLKELESSQTTKEEVAPASPDQKELVETTSQFVTRDEATLYARGYTPEQVDLAAQMSAGYGGMSILDVVNQRGFQAELESKKEVEKSSKMAIDDLSGVASFESNKDLLNKVQSGQADLTSMSSEEQKRLRDAMVKEALK